MAGFDGVRASTRERECVRGKKKKASRGSGIHTDIQKNVGICGLFAHRDIHTNSLGYL